MLTLYIANTFEEAEFNTDALNIPKEIHASLQKHESEYSFENLDLITKLSMYLTEKVFSELEVHYLKDLSDEMIKYTWSNENKELNKFFIDLLNFCEKAINEHKSIVAIGD